MATKSIFKSIEIRDNKSARALLDDINNARKAQKNIKEPVASAKRMNREEISEVFGGKWCFARHSKKSTIDFINFVDWWNRTHNA